MGGQGGAEPLEHSGARLVTSPHLAGIQRLMDGDKDAEPLPVQWQCTGILVYVSTHLGKCHLSVTSAGLSCPWGKEPTRCASVLLKKVQFLHSRVPPVCDSSNWKVIDSEDIGQGITTSKCPARERT